MNKNIFEGIKVNEDGTIGEKLDILYTPIPPIFKNENGELCLMTDKELDDFLKEIKNKGE